MIITINIIITTTTSAAVAEADFTLNLTGYIQINSASSCRSNELVYTDRMQRNVGSGIQLQVDSPRHLSYSTISPCLKVTDKDKNPSIHEMRVAD